MLKLALTTCGLFDPSRFNAWSRQQQAVIHQAVAAGMQTGGPPIVEVLRRQMQAGFAVKRPAFVKSVRAKVLDRQPDKLPALLVGSRIPWLGIHVRGGTLSGRMLIPLTEEGRRLGCRAFRRVIDALLRSGNAYFIQKNGQAILMAENLRENTSVLTRFKRAERQRSGSKTLRRNAEIPIAVLVPMVRLKRRFDLVATVHSQLPALARVIERQLNPS